MPIIQVTAPAEDQKYPIIIEAGLLNACSRYFEPLSGRKAVIVTDSHVAPLYADLLKKQMELADVTVFTAVIPEGEPSKSLQQLSMLYDFFMDHGITRKDAIVALGGGVVGDLSGYAASSWMRGIRFIQIPTTLLAQVDSSVGGKVAVNHPRGKNLIGAFYQPELVLIDTDVLQTLDERQFGAGLGEVIKYGCIADAELFSKLDIWGGRDALRSHLPEIIARCCSIKADYVLKDPHDHGVRMQLNYGHTLAHAVENLSGYGTVLHGEAVCIGMAAAADWGEKLGITPVGTCRRITDLLKKYNLPTKIPSGLRKEQMLASMSMDKKGEGKSIRIVVLTQIGTCTGYEITLDRLSELV